jgi:hypothetical protein
MPRWFSQDIRAQLDFRAVHELCKLYAQSAEPLMPIIHLSAFGILIAAGEMNKESTLTVQLVL